MKSNKTQGHVLHPALGGGLAVRLDDLRGLSNLDDSTILSFSLVLLLSASPEENVSPKCWNPS